MLLLTPISSRDYLELWKPSQGAMSYYANLNWFTLSQLSIAKAGKIVPFKGDADEENGGMPARVRNQIEAWDNCWPRLERR